MIDSVVNFLAVFSVFAGAFIVLFLVGHTIISGLKLSRGSQSMPSLALGLGMAMVSLVTALAHFLGFAVDFAVWFFLAVLLAGKLSWHIRDWVLSNKKGVHSVASWNWKTAVLGVIHSRWLPNLLISFFSSAVVMLPVARLGLTSWTAATNDYPSYVASALVWLRGEEAFQSQQFGAFGEGLVRRAGYEKPYSTGFLSFLIVLTGLSGQQLLPVLMWLPLFLLFSSLLSLQHFLVGKLGLHHILVVVAVAGSAVPAARLYDAQPGQVLMLGLVASAFVFLARSLDSEVAARQSLYFGGFAGGVLAVAMGNNFTLFVASLPLLLSFFLWLVTRRIGWSTFLVPPMLLWILTGVFIVLSLPLSSGYFASFRSQVNGEPGYDIPLASPLAFIGLQPKYNEALPLGWTFAMWISLTVVAGMLIVRRKSAPQALVNGLLLFTFVLSVTVLIWLYGPNAYHTHKFLAVAIGFVAPILVATLGDTFLRSAYVKTAVGGAILATSLNATMLLPVAFFPPETWPQLARLSPETGKINVAAGPYWRSSLIATSINPEIKVKVMEPSYYHTTEVPFPNAPLLVDENNLRKFRPESFSEVVPGLFLAEVSFDYGEEIFFNSGNELASRYLLGSWHEPENWGVWTSGLDSFVYFEVPDFSETQKLTIELEGVLHQPEGLPNELKVTINEGVSHEFFSGDDLLQGPVRISMSANELQRLEKVLVLQFDTSHFYRPSDFGSLDPRTLGFGLKAIRFFGSE